jgi:hypothetical protein
LLRQSISVLDHLFSLPPELFAPVPAQQVKAPAVRAQRIRDAIDRRRRSRRSRTVEANCIECEDGDADDAYRALHLQKYLFAIFWKSLRCRERATRAEKALLTVLQSSFCIAESSGSI